MANNKWETIYSSKNDYEIMDKKAKNKKDKTCNRIMSKTKIKDIQELKKEGIELYDVKEYQKNNLLLAFDDHKLKSRRLIKEAIAIKKSQKKKDVNKKDGNNN